MGFVCLAVPVLVSYSSENIAGVLTKTEKNELFYHRYSPSYSDFMVCFY